MGETEWENERPVKGGEIEKAVDKGTWKKMEKRAENKRPYSPWRMFNSALQNAIRDTKEEICIEYVGPGGKNMALEPSCGKGQKENPETRCPELITKDAL